MITCPNCAKEFDKIFDIDYNNWPLSDSRPFSDFIYWPRFHCPHCDAEIEEFFKVDYRVVK